MTQIKLNEPRQCTMAEVRIPDGEQTFAVNSCRSGDWS